jgi:2'-5' RNA ligase
LAKGLEKALATIGTFEVSADGEALFGPRKTRPVRLLQVSDPLVQTEAKVRRYLHQKRAWLVDETTKKRYAFRPHVTTQEVERLPEGRRVHIDRLYIVEQKGSYKKIVSVINL